MAKKERTYEIEMLMTGNPPKLQPVLKDNGHVIGPNDVINFNKTTDGMKKVDHYRIKFDIKDFGDSALRFVPDEKDVMWVQEGTQCPDDRCGLPGVIWVDKVDNKGEWIEVINMDMTELRFQFTLNFVDKSITNPTKADYIALDPGGGNQNGGTPGSDLQASALGAIVLGVGAGLVTFFGTRLFLPEW